MMKYAYLTLLLLALASCTGSSPYMPGKSATDIPSHVNTIYLKKVSVTNDSLYAGELPDDPTPSAESKEMLAIEKPIIISRLENFGYKVVENPKIKANTTMRCGVRYFGLMPLAKDTMTTWCGLYDKESAPILKVYTRRYRGGLIDYALGPSWREVAQEEAHTTIIKMVDEIRKASQ